MLSLVTDLLDAMRTYPNMLQSCGVLGSIIYVGGFALVQSGRTCGNGALYSASMIVAALLILVSLVGAFNLGAFLIQIGFVVFGVLGLCRRLALGSKLEGPPDGTTAPDAYVLRGPVSRDGSPAISGSENRPRAPADDTPVPPFPGGAAPIP